MAGNMGAAAFSGLVNDLSNVQGFVPELWSADVRKFRDQNFVMGNSCMIEKFAGGQQGDVLHVPNVPRLGVFDKTAQSPVNLQSVLISEYTIAITKYKEASLSFEDIVKYQSKYSYQQLLAKEAGYAIGRDIQNYILAHRAVINSYPSQRIYSFNNGTANLLGDGTQNAHIAGTPAPVTFAAFLQAQQKMLEADVNLKDVAFYTSPSGAISLQNITQYVSYDFNDEKPLAMGIKPQFKFMGIPIYLSSLIGPNSLTGYLNGQNAAPSPTPGVVGSSYVPDQVTGVNLVTTASAADISVNNFNWFGLPVRSGAGATAADGGQTLGANANNQWATSIMCSKEWFRLCMQQDVMQEQSRQALYLADAWVNSTIYGGKAYKADAAVVIHHSAV